jgi:hypothetical protein
MLMKRFFCPCMREIPEKPVMGAQQKAQGLVEQNRRVSRVCEPEGTDKFRRAAEDGLAMRQALLGVRRSSRGDIWHLAGQGDADEENHSQYDQ